MVDGDMDREEIMIEEEKCLQRFKVSRLEFLANDMTFLAPNKCILVYSVAVILAHELI